MSEFVRIAILLIALILMFTLFYIPLVELIING